MDEKRRNSSPEEDRKVFAKLDPDKKPDQSLEERRKSQEIDHRDRIISSELDDRKQDRKLRKSIAIILIGLFAFEFVFFATVLCCVGLGYMNLDWKILAPSMVALFSQIAYSTRQMIEYIFPASKH